MWERASGNCILRKIHIATRSSEHLTSNICKFKHQKNIIQICEWWWGREKRRNKSKTQGKHSVYSHANIINIITHIIFMERQTAKRKIRFALSLAHFLSLSHFSFPHSLTLSLSDPNQSAHTAAAATATQQYKKDNSKY
jgi:hypothetical protein